MYNDINQLREAYYSIDIGEECEEVWIKKLRNILSQDIHDKPLGCKINDTHIKVGSVHLGSFYEAQILFSHAKWVNRFSNWIKCNIEDNGASVLIVGYETYLEPVLTVLKSSNNNIDYCIYEEPKYIQRSKKSQTRLRYFDIIKQNIKKYKKIIYICGIASTLTTYKKMKKEIRGQTERLELPEELFLSLIQVLPRTNNNSFDFYNGDHLEWNKKTKTVNNEDVTVKFLVDVYCEWQNAYNCKWCFPDDTYLERPIISTNDSSVIPLQMIGTKNNDITKSNNKSILFQKHKGNFRYYDYLYYNHIDRGDHHFQYYIRTGALMNNILNGVNLKDFDSFCSNLKNQFYESGDGLHSVNIIISPLHYTNETFVCEINKRVFDNTAHIITFDAKKEFRSNFETKYSNFAYVLEQIGQQTNEDNDTHINFYFVDDQLITGDTINRAKSFVASMMRKYQGNDRQQKKYTIFAGVIIFLDRNSSSSRLNYVDNLENYCSFIDISIPSIRNYGDSCPLCKAMEISENIVKSCTLFNTFDYWNKKVDCYRVKTLPQAKKDNKDESEYIKNRHFVRLFCENDIWISIKNLWTEEEITEAFLKSVLSTLKKLTLCDQYEYLISYLKIISRPFLYYRENVKKSAIKILLFFIESLLTEDDYPIVIVSKCISKYCNNKKQFSAEPKQESTDLTYEKYSLLCALISCLSHIESNYVLKYDNIIRICKFVEDLNSNLLTFNTVKLKSVNSIIVREQGDDSAINVNGIYSVILFNFKYVICGVSGNEKAKTIENELLNIWEKPNSKYRTLITALYLENINLDMIPSDRIKKIDSIINSTNNTMYKYEEICNLLQKNNCSCKIFMPYYNNTVVELYGKSELIDMNSIFPENYSKVINEIEATGYYIKDNSFFAFKLIDINSVDIKSFFIVFRFEKGQYENIEKVRDFLILRHRLIELLKNDISTGAIDAAIKANAAEYILNTDKTQQHGQSKDINQMYDLTALFLENGMLNEKDNLNKYKAINLFMNRCIAFGATKEIVTSYYNNDLDVSKSTLQQPFYARMQKVSIKKDHLSEYLDEITKNDSNYLKEIINDVKTTDRIKNIKITVADELKNQWPSISYYPEILACKTQKTESGIILLGIIDSFIRNAIKHGKDDDTITIDFKKGADVIGSVNHSDLPKEYFSESYSISVKNTFSEDSNECLNESVSVFSGLTKTFFVNCLGRYKDPYLYFFINMGKTSDSKFESKITCVIAKKP